MKHKNIIFAILAFFCLVVSACAVSAADDGNITTLTDDMYDGYVRESPDMSDLHKLMEDNATDNSTDDGDLDSEAIHDSMVLPPDYAHSEMDQMNATNATNATGHAAGEPGHANANPAHKMPATGNPILLLLAVGSVLGGACAIRKK